MVFHVITQMHADRDSPTASQIISPFLRLPPEIRNMISAYVLGGCTWSIKMTQDTAGNTRVRADDGIENALALLKVNRQIHAEAHLFPYIYNTFAGIHNGHLHDWVKSRTHAERTCIRAIKRYKRGYIIKDMMGQSLTVSPGFWMDEPKIAAWGLDGLQRIEVEVALQKWSWDNDKDDMKTTIDEVLVKLQKMVEVEHPGVEVRVFTRRGY